MKTGFIHGYLSKPKAKRYSYHGEDRKCLIEPDPDPFEEFPNNPACYWELIRDTDFNGGGGWYYSYEEGLSFFPSDEPDLCVNGWPDGWIRYYYCEVTLKRYLEPGWCKWYWNNGLLCRVWEYWIYGETIHKCWFDHVWDYSPTMFACWGSGPGSHIKIWRSSNGLLPPGSPC